MTTSEGRTERAIVPGWVILALAVVFSLMGVASHAAEKGVVRLATTAWPPYVGPDLKGSGFGIEIVRRAFEKAGYGLEVKFYPWKRVLLSVKNGKADAGYPAYHTEERARVYAYSDQTVRGPLVLFVRKDRPFSFESLIDLKGRRIGVVAGYANTPEFDAATFINKVTSSSDANNIRSLINGRVDMAVADRYTGLHILRTQFKKDSEAVVAVKRPLQQKSIHLIFPKDSEPHTAMARAFNNALTRLRLDGEVRKILFEHGF
ncbi:MAG: transporter substrate-binding domain-containing protein [Pseudomonadota bacterium]